MRHASLTNARHMHARHVQCAWKFGTTQTIGAAQYNLGCVCLVCVCLGLRYACRCVATCSMRRRRARADAIAHAPCHGRRPGPCAAATRRHTAQAPDRRPDATSICSRTGRTRITGRARRRNARRPGMETCSRNVCAPTRASVSFARQMCDDGVSVMLFV